MSEPQTFDEALALADDLNLPFTDLADFSTDRDMLTMMPVQWMMRYACLPLGQEGNQLKLAFSDRDMVNQLEELELLTKKRISLVVAPKSRIEEILKESESSQRVLQDATSDFHAQTLSGEHIQDDLDVDKLVSDGSPLVRLVDTTIYNALERRASDIHIETEADRVVIKYRIDGVLYEAMQPIDRKYHTTLISRIKVMSELDIAEKRVPQDGRFKLTIKGRGIDFRVSIMPTIHGENAVIRILDKESSNASFKNLSLPVLGFSGPLLRDFRQSIREPYGMVLVTGPTGSGKTTTLYACISEIRNTEDKIITIEDPVEYQLQGVTQIPINEKKQLTFARGLRSILRHDPDKIMVGEIRDTETAQIAIQSALTGHLVFTTVHANNVIDVIGRFVNMGVDLYNFVSALNCVLAQRLIRLTCQHCKHPMTPTPEEFELSALDPKEFANITLFEGNGCLSCHGTGYRGRTVIAEALRLNDEVREAILDRRPIRELKELSTRNGMRFLREAAVDLLKQGVTTLHEINKVTFID
ncbi:Type II/IV secretion system protein [Sulfidibacter corallicola]|uniref:Type II/IV secretion system protein n=1 Tax=Sulfidibacter corallicola TaxID=2818388 RepID=A0A8A4TY40_SULCO|nr:GspE/PulE family protein [Sulfidibacter corallicola]QTD54151.1 type II/IV secretion system protein [Sulfidibacter corallicola]